MFKLHNLYSQNVCCEHLISLGNLSLGSAFDRRTLLLKCVTNYSIVYQATFELMYESFFWKNCFIP